MKKLLSFLLAMVMIVSLCACDVSDGWEYTEDDTTEDTEDTTETTDSTEDTEGTEDTENTENTENTEEIPAPLHSDLYIEGVSQEQMIEYFNEVVLSIEYSTGDGDATRVQKWKNPIYYRIVGNATDMDLSILNDLFSQLNQVDGFPGIFPADSEHSENLTIWFLDQYNFNLQFSSVINGETADGAVQFWYYTFSNEIYEGQIGYRTDISQEIRNSVLLEEIINLLGINDTVLRSDSITYQYSSDATELSDIDWVIMKLLYNPKILCGMKESACKLVVPDLYY